MASGGPNNLAYIGQVLGSLQGLPSGTGVAQAMQQGRGTASATPSGFPSGPPEGRIRTNEERLAAARALSARNTTTVDIARNTRTSDDETTPPPPVTKGTIVTLLDITNRDLQDDDLFPLASQTTWFTRDTERRVIPFAPVIQEIPIRGPGSFGQRFSFDLGSVLVGDLMFGAVLQIRLSHWIDPQAQLLYEAGLATYTDPATAWEYANALGAAIIQEAELEIDGKTIETIDGDFINVFSLLFPDFNTQFGVAYDHLGRRSTTSLMAAGRRPRLYPTEDGILHCVLPFFFGRQRQQEALPMISIKEGLVRMHVTLRPFEECVRQMRGFRASCTATPLDQTIQMQALPGPVARPTRTPVAPPPFKSLQLLTYGALLDGAMRDKMLRDPYEMLHRELQTFYFEEPLKYTIAKRSDTDTVTVQLPLEANHPVEEIIWFVRRKGVADNNAWTNYSSVLDQDWGTAGQGAIVAAAKPLLQRAVLQLNGITVCDAEEQYYRQLIARAHRGGLAAYNSFIYGYPIARHPGQHQPSGSMNASKLNSLRLTLEVRNPGADGWEVKVFCLAMNWLRFQNGLANSMFES